MFKIGLQNFENLAYNFKIDLHIFNTLFWLKN
jgi:hypothetical protein